MKMKNPIFAWDENSGCASCIISVDNHNFVGTATCHENDKDMCSKLVGQEIAFKRAYIDFLKYFRELFEHKLHSFEVLLKELKDSPKYSENNYAIIKIQKEILNLKRSLSDTRKTIKNTKRNLDNYIQMKEEFYQKIRERRISEAKGQE